MMMGRIVGHEGLRKAAAVAALCLATMAFFNLDSRYSAIDPDILPEPGEGPGDWFGRGAEIRPLAQGGWEATLTAGRTGGSAILAWRLDDPGRYDYLRISGEITADGLDPDDLHAQAGIVLNAYDASGHLRWHRPRVVVELHGPAGWARHERVIPVDPDAVSVRIVVFAAGRGAVLSVRALSLAVVSETQLSVIARWGLIVLWIAAGVWIALPAVAGSRRSAAGTLAAAAGAAIVLLVLMPQPQFNDSIRSLVTSLDQAVAGRVEQGAGTPVTEPPAAGEPATGSDTPGPPETAAEAGTPAAAPSGPGPFMRLARQTVFGLEWQDIGHMSAHVVFAVLLFSALPGAPLPWRFLFVVLAAVASETLQYFVFTRSVRSDDFALNIVGVLAGGLVWLAVAAVRRRTASARAGSA
jgi:hypothetical protein